MSVSAKACPRNHPSQSSARAESLQPPHDVTSEHCPGWGMLTTVSQLPVTSYQLPVTSYQLPVTSYQLPVTSYQLPVTSYQFPSTRHARAFRFPARKVVADGAGGPVVRAGRWRGCLARRWWHARGGDGGAMIPTTFGLGLAAWLASYSRLRGCGRWGGWAGWRGARARVSPGWRAWWLAAWAVWRAASGARMASRPGRGPGLEPRRGPAA